MLVMGQKCWGDTLECAPEESESPESAATRKQLQYMLEEAISSLPVKQQIAVRHYYGLNTAALSQREVWPFPAYLYQKGLHWVPSLVYSFSKGNLWLVRFL
jgi:hypothetical protein